MNDQEMRELFREMRDEPVPADSLARVRTGVDRRIQKRPWVSGWRIAAALVMAGCIVAGFLWMKPAKPVQQVSAPEIAQVSPPVEIPVRSTPHPRRARSRPAKVEPVLIRIETPDPDVVILLVN